jgi:hypothetical protein
MDIPAVNRSMALAQLPEVLARFLEVGAALRCGPSIDGRYRLHDSMRMPAAQALQPSKP